MQYDENKAKFRQLKQDFISRLRATDREGVNDCIDELERLGFFSAPASTRFHLAHEGGLLQHSMNVCDVALRLRDSMIQLDPSLASALPEDSVVIASLLHDVCKADIYKPVLKRQKQPDGSWVDAPAYDCDFSHFPFGHGEKSVVVLILSGLALTDDEMLSIRWHMSAWDLALQSPDARANINAAGDVCPLCSLIQSADTLAANLLERSNDL